MVCGGDYYDRPMVQTKSSSGFSSTSQAVFSKPRSERKLNKSCDPKRWVEEKLKCHHKNPIIVAIDVTGSMGNWTKILYDKLPMFYGQIMVKKYLEDPSLSFCANGDAVTDSAPLQVTEFGQGKQIDQLISKMWLEGGGGGNQKETYELGAYFYLSRCDISVSELPFLFMTGDEGFYRVVEKKHIKDCIGLEVPESVSSRLVFEETKKKFKGNVFLLKKPYYDSLADQKITDEWKSVLGDHLILFKTPKAVVDIMLGCIALVGGTRTLEEYIEDLRDRGQEEERITEVEGALRELSLSCSKKMHASLMEDYDDEDEDDEVENEEEVLRMIQSSYKSLSKEVLKGDQKIQSGREELEKKKIQLGKEFPKEFRCCVTNDVLVDPAYIHQQTNLNFEQKVIKKWVEINDMNPVNGVNFIESGKKDVIIHPNETLKRKIMDWK